MEDQRGEKVEAGADKFYCVSFRPLHLSALFRSRTSQLLSARSFSLSLTHARTRRPVSRKKRGTMMYAPGGPVKSLLEEWPSNFAS